MIFMDFPLETKTGLKTSASELVGWPYLRTVFLLQNSYLLTATGWSWFRNGTANRNFHSFGFRRFFFFNYLKGRKRWFIPYPDAAWTYHRAAWLAQTSLIISVNSDPVTLYKMINTLSSQILKHCQTGKRPSHWSYRFGSKGQRPLPQPSSRTRLPPGELQIHCSFSMFVYREPWKSWNAHVLRKQKK